MVSAWGIYSEPTSVRPPLQGKLYWGTAMYCWHLGVSSTT